MPIAFVHRIIFNDYSVAQEIQVHCSWWAVTAPMSYTRVWCYHYHHLAGTCKIRRSVCDASMWNLPSSEHLHGRDQQMLKVKKYPTVAKGQDSYSRITFFVLFPAVTCWSAWSTVTSTPPLEALRYWQRPSARKTP